MKIAIFGASGIIGQHLRLCIPAGVEAIWIRREADSLHRGLDLTDAAAIAEFLELEHPDAIINLAGESRPDVVENNPEPHHRLNAVVPGEMARWCHAHDAHYVHVSTQAVFNGDEPPYAPNSQRIPVNQYGLQKLEAEHRVENVPGNWTIVRPTFVLGVRPLPLVGRSNPMELILGGEQRRQVGDRWFSVSFARDVASTLWEIARGAPRMEAVHIGIDRTCRHELAKYFDPEVKAVPHNDFPGIAPRPVDTTYAEGKNTPMKVGSLERCRDEFKGRDNLAVLQRARELALFFGRSESECLQRLQLGFIPLHHAVSEDFRRANPKGDAELLEWYRSTEAYIWELSAYHCDPGFNYSGMCQGVGDRLKAAGAQRVLCLGDGIGDLTLHLKRRGFEAVYHDLYASRTAAFAQFRAWMYTGEPFVETCTLDWLPLLWGGCADVFDAIVSFDFLEHVTDVPAWTAAIQHALKPRGLFFAQNAFACGSGPEGSIPMHLSCNDRFEKDWDPMLFGMGFSQESSNWYRAAA